MGQRPSATSAWTSGPAPVADAWAVGPAPSVITEAPPPVEEPSMAGRVLRGAGNAVVEGVKGAATLSGIPGFLRDGPMGAIRDQVGVGKGMLQAHYDQYRKAKDAEAKGRTSEMFGHSVAAALPVVGPMAARWGEMIGGGEAPEAAGEMLVGAATPWVASKVPKTVAAAKTAFQAAKVSKAAKMADGRFRAVELAIPSSKATPYTKADWDVAAPYLDAEHAKAPITSTAAMRDALDGAITQIESDISGVVQQFPLARLQPPVVAEVTTQLKTHPRREFMNQGLKELDDLPVGAPMTLEEADALRRQLNAENKAILKKNSYDVATARKVDPGFAAREIAANTIRDTLYDFLEQNNAGPIRQLRREEGSLIKLRNAADSKAMAGQRPVAGSGEAGPVRRAAAELAAKGATAAGAATAGPVGAVIGAQVGDTIGAAVRGGRRTRDDLITRAFRR